MCLVDVHRIGKLSFLPNSLTKDDILIKEKYLEFLSFEIESRRSLGTD
jgi:hypothetical protein